MSCSYVREVHPNVPLLTFFCFRCLSEIWQQLTSLCWLIPRVPPHEGSVANMGMKYLLHTYFPPSKMSQQRVEGFTCHPVLDRLVVQLLMLDLSMEFDMWSAVNDPFETYCMQTSSDSFLPPEFLSSCHVTLHLAPKYHLLIFFCIIWAQVVPF